MVIPITYSVDELLWYQHIFKVSRQGTTTQGTTLQQDGITLISFNVLVFYHQYLISLAENSFELTLLKNKQEEKSTKLFSKF